jgi:HK97 gp10 family phage protein
MAEIKGLKETAARLRALPPRLGSKGGGPLRYALMQGAKVIVEEAKHLAPVQTGHLRQNIVAKRHRNPRAVGATERYDIGMKGGTKRYAGNVRNRRSGRAGQKYRTAGTAFYGRFVELGTAKMKARPFLRPAIEGKGGAAVEAFRVNFLKAVEVAERKLAKGG